MVKYDFWFLFFALLNNLKCACVFWRISGVKQWKLMKQTKNILSGFQPYSDDSSLQALAREASPGCLRGCKKWQWPRRKRWRCKGWKSWKGLEYIGWRGLKTWWRGGCLGLGREQGQVLEISLWHWEPVWLGERSQRRLEEMGHQDLN